MLSAGHFYISQAIGPHPGGEKNAMPRSAQQRVIIQEPKAAAAFRFLKSRAERETGNGQPRLETIDFPAWIAIEKRTYAHMTHREGSWFSRDGLRERVT
jgi:hypothetical protein